MNPHILVILFTASTAFAVTPDGLSRGLERASLATGNDYLAARSELEKLDPKTLPALYEQATRSDVEWRVQLMARIAYERITRGKDIVELLNHDWLMYHPYHHPERYLPPVAKESDGKPRDTLIVPITGPHSLMGKDVKNVCRISGLWYYYVEQTWKLTREGPQVMASDGKFMGAWPVWCAEVVKEQPEKIWWARAVADRLEAVDFKSYSDRVLFKALIDSAEGDVVPFLIRRFDDYFRADAKGLDESHWMWKESYPLRFLPIFAMADSSHVEQLGEHFQSHRLLHPHQGKLEEARTRLPKDAVERLRFRLGTNLFESPLQP
jgi:hypothetical protein